MRGRVIAVVADILSGLAALVLFVLGVNYSHVGADLRIGVVALAILCLCAGLVRGQGRPGNAWLKGFLVNSGSSLVLLILGWGFSVQPIILAILLLIANLFTICGVRVRHLWAAQSAARGGMMLFVSLAALVVAAVTTIPALTTRIATRKTSAPAPTFSISRLDGTVVSSSDFRGASSSSISGRPGVLPVVGSCRSWKSSTGGTKETRRSAFGRSTSRGTARPRKKRMTSCRKRATPCRLLWAARSRSKPSAWEACLR